MYECLNLETGELYVTKHVPISGDRAKIEKEVANLKREIMLLKEL